MLQGAEFSILNIYFYTISSLVIKEKTSKPNNGPLQQLFIVSGIRILVNVFVTNILPLFLLSAYVKSSNRPLDSSDHKTVVYQT
jgi:hypothetical protein